MCANSGIQVMQLLVQSDHSYRALGFYRAQTKVTQIQLTMALIWVHSNVPISRTGTIQQFHAVTTFCRLNGGDSGEGLRHFIIPLSGLYPGCWEKLFFTPWRASGLCAGLLLYLLIVQEELYWKNNLRWSVEVLNGAEGKQRIPLPPK